MSAKIHADNVFVCLVTLTFDLSTLGFRDLWWNTSVSSLVILAASAFEISRRKTDKHTKRRQKPHPCDCHRRGW